MRVVLPKVSSSIVAKKIGAFASSDFQMSFSSEKKAEIMNRNYVILLGLAEASALPKEILFQLDAPSTFHTDSLLELFYSLDSIFWVRRRSV